ncbi:MAG: hypothetical protein ACK4MH_01750 [Brevundimonas sp.]
MLCADCLRLAETREQKLRHLVLKAGIDFEKQRIALCDEALDVISGAI